ncbi:MULTISPECIES: YbaB/EbfC family nucleoid-associated protein [unclassified Nocardia]|uniref:YbaB/EbfC family nucleoid-associated protein n=1 Tax=unclassified Nocardia TaxID=2637762 RepID=UPI001CE4983D|nr:MULTISPECIES: YbaB/EbfC family nucleoid-associated protein [unclassified Nocardia]
MNSSEYDQLRARTDALQGQVDTMLDAYQRQIRDIADARDNLAVVRVDGWSADNLIRVTANSAGVPVEVWVDPAAFKRTTPEKLGPSIAEAAQNAARAAKARVAAELAPITEIGAQFEGIDGVVGHLPDFDAVVGDILPPPPAAEPPAPAAAKPKPVDQDDDGPHWKGW